MFKLHCPKCHSTRITIAKDAVNCWKGPDKYVFHCGACGKVLYGDAVDAEVDQQEKAYHQSIIAGLSTGSVVVKPEPVVTKPPEPAKAMEIMDWSVDSLAKYDIGFLRSYASKKLGMVGASKIPGGKKTLIERMLLESPNVVP